EFAAGDDTGIVVAVRDGGAQLGLGERDLVLAKTWLGEHLLEQLQGGGSVLLGSGEGKCADRVSDGGLHVGGCTVQQRVDLFPGLDGGTAGAHDDPDRK